MSHLATRTPDRDTYPETYTCRRCGIRRPLGGRPNSTGYCKDCHQHATNDQLITRKAN